MYINKNNFKNKQKMKKNFRTIFMSMLAIATVSSCSKEDISNMDNQDGKVCMAISVKKVDNTRAAISRAEVDNTNNTLNDVCVVAYDESGVVLSNTGVTEENGAYSFAVSTEARQLLMMTSPTTLMRDATAAGDRFTDLQAAITATATDVTKSAGFTMINENGLVDIIKEEGNGTVENPITLTIGLNRLASKVTVTVPSTITKPEGVTATIKGFLLNGTNKSVVPAPEVKYIKAEETLENAYSVDGNFKIAYSAGEADAIAALSWLSSSTTTTTDQSWVAAAEALDTPSTEMFCLENTMHADFQDNRNLTKVLVKAEYLPAATFAAGVSWFRFNGTAYTAATLKALYATATTEQKASLDAFLTHILGTSLTISWGTSTDADILTALDAVPHVAYKAATCPDYAVEFFHKATCYYNVAIAHITVEGNEGIIPFGSWGVVRNNAYAISIKEIAGIGLPYIPDFTDANISDPNNIGGEGLPEDGHVTLKVTVTVNPWLLKKQDVVLG